MGVGWGIITPKFCLQIIILTFKKMLMAPSGLFPPGHLKATEVMAVAD